MTKDSYMLPNVSIVIPCYNQAHFLRECISSLLLQTFSNWEAIIVDDASSQGDVAGILAEVNDNRCRLLRHSFNRGLGAARNTGFQAALTNIILPLDADDCLHPDYLYVTLTSLNNHLDIDCVFTDFQLFGEVADVRHFTIRTPSEMLLRQWIPGPGTLMRKRVWEAVKGYLELPQPLCGNEDWDFWLSAIEHNIKALHIPEPLYLYRKQPQSLTATTMDYYEYKVRNIIYTRHKQFYDSYRTGCRFRCEGYRISATASLLRKKSWRASWLAIRGWSIDMRQHDLFKLAFIALIPKFVRLYIRKFLHKAALKGKSKWWVQTS